MIISSKYDIRLDVCFQLYNFLKIEFLYELSMNIFSINKMFLLFPIIRDIDINADYLGERKVAEQ